MIPVFAPKSSFAMDIAALFANGERGAWYETGGTTTLSVVCSLMTNAILRASLLQDPELTLFSVEVNGRALGDINNSGGTRPITSADAVEYARYNQGIASPATFDYINQVLNPYMLANPGNYSAYLALAEKTLFQTTVGVEPVAAAGQPVGLVLDKSGNANHARQSTANARPIYGVGPYRIDFDGIDDALITTFATSLGSNCTVGRAVPGTGAQILTGQTIGTSFTASDDYSSLVIVDRALTSVETKQLTAYLNARAA